MRLFRKGRNPWTYRQKISPVLDREEGEEKGNESERGQEGEREGVGEQRQTEREICQETERQGDIMGLSSFYWTQTT